MDSNDKNIELDGAEIFANWNQLVQTEEKPVATDDILDMALDSLAIDGGEQHFLDLFQNTNLSNMDLVALKLVKQYTPDFKSESQQMKTQMHHFLMRLAGEHGDELRVAGLSEEQIGQLVEGKLPINWTVHLKYPLAYGGIITENNLVLMPHHPFHEDLHAFINQQIVTDAGVMSPAVLYVPVPKASVYVPYGSQDMAKEVIHFQQGGMK